MYYYILDENSVVANRIVVADGDDPSKYGAIADERKFRIGDTWIPKEPTQLDRVEAQATYTAMMTDTLLPEEV